jgi:hypothetical protein
MENIKDKLALLYPRLETSKSVNVFVLSGLASIILMNMYSSSSAR